MKTKKITESEISPLKISSLPTRPTAPGAFGGKGYTPSEMKRAFDLLPTFIIERLNSLIDELEEAGGSPDSIKTGIYDGHTLEMLFTDIVSGDASTYLNVSGESLFDALSRLEGRINKLVDDLINEELEITSYTADALSPTERRRELTDSAATYSIRREAEADSPNIEEPKVKDEEDEGVNYEYVYVFSSEKGEDEE